MGSLVARARRLSNFAGGRRGARARPTCLTAATEPAMARGPCASAGLDTSWRDGSVMLGVDGDGPTPPRRAQRRRDRAGDAATPVRPRRGIGGEGCELVLLGLLKRLAQQACERRASFSI